MLSVNISVVWIQLERPSCANSILRRHPLALAKTGPGDATPNTNIDIVRKNSHDPNDALGYKRHPMPDRYNFDETGFRVPCKRELAMLCESISGDGEVLPSMINLTGALHLQQWYTSETSYSNDELSLG